MKHCNKCNSLLPFSNFHKSSRNSDGRQSTCKICCSVKNKEYKEIHKERLYKETKDWKLRNKDKVKTYMKEYRLSNRDKIYELNKLWNDTNRDRYLAIKNSASALRRANKKNAFVSWADKHKIKSLYKEARSLTLLTGIQHHVDHIYPLVSPLVSGLHCEANLRVIPYYENLSKSNKLIEDIV